MSTSNKSPALGPIVQIPVGTQSIVHFEGVYEFLSNFYPCDLRMNGILFFSAEQAYHWHKLADKQDRLVLVSMRDPMQAKRFSRKCEIIPEWDEVRTAIMLSVLIAKFEQDQFLRLKLLETSPKILIEGNHWNDRFWGATFDGYSWVGENHLGRLLMNVRDNL